MKNSKIYDVVLIAIMAAVLCVASPFSLPIGPVPISLATFVIYLLVFPLGWKKGTLSCLVYIAIGLVGVPVFSGFSGGVGKVLGPTGGYLLGYIAIAILAGIFVEKFANNHILHFVGMILGTLICYGFGTAWLAYQAGMSFVAALGAGVIPFIPGDLVKMIVACLIGPVLAKQMKRIRP